MTTAENIARLLNFSHQDGSAFAEVLHEYFDDREDAHDSEDDFLDTGMNLHNRNGLIKTILYIPPTQNTQYAHKLEFFLNRF